MLAVKFLPFICLLSSFGFSHQLLIRDRITVNYTITFKSDSWTTFNRKWPPLRQMSCTGDFCDEVEVKEIKCTNKLYNISGQVQPLWDCKSRDLRYTNYTLGPRPRINCEGFDSDKDPYILRGSCAIEYRLVKSDAKFAAKVFVIIFIIFIIITLIWAILDGLGYLPEECAFGQCPSESETPSLPRLANEELPRVAPLAQGILVRR